MAGREQLIEQVTEPGLEHVDLAGHVEIVRAGGEAGVDHGPAGPGERPRAVQHQRGAGEVGLVEWKRAPGQFQALGNRAPEGPIVGARGIIPALPLNRLHVLQSAARTARRSTAAACKSSAKT